MRQQSPKLIAKPLLILHAPAASTAMADQTHLPCLTFNARRSIWAVVIARPTASERNALYPVATPRGPMERRDAHGTRWEQVRYRSGTSSISLPSNNQRRMSENGNR
jgi:hypothetical protein